MVLLGAVQDGHTTVTWHQLTHWEECPTWKGFTASSYSAGSTTVSFDKPCDYFTTGVWALPEPWQIEHCLCRLRLLLSRACRLFDSGLPAADELLTADQLAYYS
jgi:hypothetical protein